MLAGSRHGSVSRVYISHLQLNCAFSSNMQLAYIGTLRRRKRYRIGFIV